MTNWNVTKALLFIAFNSKGGYLCNITSFAERRRHVVRALDCSAEGLSEFEFSSGLAVHPIVNGYLINFREGLRQWKERIEHHLPNAVPKTWWGSNTPVT